MPITYPTKERTDIYFRSILQEEQGKYRKHPNEHTETISILQNIPLHELMDLKVDYAFKQLFGNEKNKDITIIFLNAFLKRTGRDKIVDIQFADKEAGGERRNDKQSLLDLLVITDTSEKINVEIQFTNKYDMVKRSIYYWSGIYRSTLEKKMNYHQLKPVIAINIMNFSLFKWTDRFYTTYHLYEDEDKFKLTDVMEFHFVEMPKLIKAWQENKLDPQNDILVRWLLLLGMVDYRKGKVHDKIYEVLEGIAMEDETLRKAFKNWEELSMTEEEFLAYEARKKAIIDEEAAKREAEIRLKEGIRESRKKGIEEGLKEGRKEGREEVKEEVVLRMLTTGLTAEVIAEYTGLPTEKILEIKREKQQ